jgi:hypothetical protein
MMAILTPERNEERLRLYGQGLLDPQIGHAQGVTSESVYGWRRRRKLPPNDSLKIAFVYGNEAKHALMRERLRLIEIGWTDASIARHQHRDCKAIRDFRRRQGLAAGPGTLDDKPAVVSWDTLAGDSHIADPSWSNWLEEMGATVW